MFVGRRPNGTIYGTWTVRQWKDQEELPDDHQEVVAFVNRPAPAPSKSIEDRVTALEAKADTVRVTP